MTDDLQRHVSALVSHIIFITILVSLFLPSVLQLGWKLHIYTVSFIEVGKFEITFFSFTFQIKQVELLS